MIDIQKEIERGYAAKEAQRWPTYCGRELDRSQYVTSSEVLNCARRIKYEKQWSSQHGNMPFPNWGYAERGNIIEAWIVEMLTLAGWELLHAGTEQRSFVVGCQSGTPDGMAVMSDPAGVIVLLEFKSIDPRTNYRNLPKPNHIAQVQQNMDLVSANLNVGIELGILYYQDASNLQKSKQFNLPVDHKYQAELQTRAEMIVAADTPADLPNEGMFNGDCDRCGFTAECSRLVAGDFDGLQNAGKGVFK